jgi:hypothetical protein
MLDGQSVGQLGCLEENRVVVAESPGGVAGETEQAEMDLVEGSR